MADDHQFIGIIAGGSVAICILAMVITRSLRKRSRVKRTANRSSMFEPWQTAPALDDEPYEKPGVSIEFPLFSLALFPDQNSPCSVRS